MDTVFALQKNYLLVVKIKIPICANCSECFIFIEMHFILVFFKIKVYVAVGSRSYFMYPSKFLKSLN